MKKKLTLLTTVVLCAVCIAVGSVATGVIQEITAELRTDFKVEVDGELKNFKNVKGEDVYPILYEGTTYLPVRAIGELMGKTVFWYEDEKRVALKDTTVTDADVIVSGEQKTVNANADRAQYIDKEAAKQIALDKAGLTQDKVRFDRVELDEDDGIWHYEVEFETGGVDYEFDIGAINGAILRWEIDPDDDDKDGKDNNKSKNVILLTDANANANADANANAATETAPEFITKDEAKEIALNKAGITAENVVFSDFELDEDDGLYHYEIEFRKDGVEYEIDIKADDGTVLKWEADIDD